MREKMHPSCLSLLLFGLLNYTAKPIVLTVLLSLDSNSFFVRSQIINIDQDKSKLQLGKNPTHKHCVAVIRQFLE